jgi:hypothetical protein
MTERPQSRARQVPIVTLPLQMHEASQTPLYAAELQPVLRPLCSALSR